MAKNKAKTVVVKDGTKAEAKAGKREESAVTLARPSANTGENFYENSLKELQVLAQNDSYAKKVNAGPLGEARGQDVFRLHTTLKAVHDAGTTVWAAVSKVDHNLHANSRAITDLVEKTRTDIWTSVENTKNSLSTAVKSGTNNVTETVGEGVGKLDAAIGSVHKAVTSGFNKLAQATAGTEENLRTQTQAFSKEVAALLSEVQNTLEKAVTEFRDESTRLIDKRFNQSDVAFAAVRADQEVIKALLTDIIKDRMGRAEPRSR